jgi:phosphate transport system substrate-binding protein
MEQNKKKMSDLNTSQRKRNTTLLLATIVIIAVIVGSATYMSRLGTTPAPTTPLPTTSTPTSTIQTPSSINPSSPTSTPPAQKWSANQKGSDTLLVLAQRWAESYMSQHTEAQIAVSGGGSGTGIAALINKQIELCDASRPMSDKEIADAKKNSVDPVEWRVALDGIAVIVNPSNPLTSLTFTQLKAIYNGSYINWQNVGGKDAPIVAYGRQSNSGTYVYWQETILKNQNYRTDMQSLNGNADIAEAVARDPNGIGYVGIAYASARKGEIKILTVQAKVDQPAVEPTNENVISGKYPISRYLFIYTNGMPADGIKDYLKFIIGPDGQKLAQETEFIPLPSQVSQEELPKLS